jgi:hypothetical protein
MNTIQEKNYSSIKDYIITINNYDISEINATKFTHPSWVSIRINKKLDSRKFKELLFGFSTHPNYWDKNYYLYFNRDAYKRLPKIDKQLKVHQHVKAKIYVGDSLLKVMPKYSNNWYDVSGGVELDEKPEDAIKREIKEELGFEVNEVEYVRTKSFTMNIPILQQGVKTLMHFYKTSLGEIPSIKINRGELKSVKIGATIID